MDDIATILLILVEGSTLLEDPCAPKMVVKQCGWHHESLWLSECSMCLEGPWVRYPGDRHPGQPQALVLAQDATVQRHGALCLADFDSPSSNLTFGDVAEAVRAALAGNDDALYSFLDKQRYIGWRIVYLYVEENGVQDVREP